MSRARIPLRASSPKRLSGNPFAHHAAIDGALTLPPDQRQALIKAGRDAVTVLREGKGDELGAWAALADLLNIGEALAEGGICNDVGERTSSAILGGQLALSCMAERHQRGAALRFRGLELAAVDTALWRFEAQCSFCSRREFDAARKAVVDRIAGALAGNGGAGVKVLQPVSA